MQVRIPLTNKTFYLGMHAESKANSLRYGFMNNGFSQLISGKGTRISFETIYTLYNNVADIKRAVGKIQDTSFREGYKMVDPNDDTKDGNPGETQQFDEIINTPRQSFVAFMRLTLRDLCVAGNAYWHIVRDMNGNVMRIDVVDPRTMSLLADKEGNIFGYVQRVFGHNSIQFEPDEIIHIVMDYSTENALLGVSPIESIVWEGKAELAASMTNWFFYENNAVPSHLLIVDQNITDDQQKKIKDELNKEYKGAEKRFKAAIIPHLKDVKTVAISQREMQYIKTRMLGTKKVVVAYGVDSFLLGYTDGVQRGNSAEIKDSFYNDTIRQYETLIEEAFNEKLFPILGIVNSKFLAKMQSYVDSKELYDRSRSDFEKGIITGNEARQIRGMEPSENALMDDQLVGGVPIDDLGFEALDAAKSLKDDVDLKQKRMNNLLG